MTQVTHKAASNPRLRAVQIDVGNEVRSYTSGPQRITTVPLTIRRRHNRKLLIIPPGATAVSGGFDAPMIKTLGKAFYWQQQIDDGTYASANALARALKLEPGWVAEVLRLVTLAPDIIEAILVGRQPRQLNLQTLRGRIDSLPRDWVGQREVLGFAKLASPD
jgi:hypothetical protein